MSILVLGLGNTIMSDDGFGVRAVNALSSRYRFRGPVKVLDGGTLGLDLLPHLEEVDKLLIVDALDMRGEPGQVFRIEGEEVPRAFASKLSVHQMGLQDLLAVADLQGYLPQQLVVWGVQPACIEMGTELTATVAAALPEVMEHLIAELRSWGVEVLPDQRES
ncbi:MAG: HyaD/HybD family hydrogenase maturation endopeptidase [Deltaproteobacteria bacterium]|jgi:hydrogenase maturation protease|nr:HyaD/HybD family hydrogenase maturation endopeptidase [Deltaproteobacteria bacterium]MBW2475912.1 HyaD/HybD family hydrogenase maturation endopeptidase [Deltaproteobacteria bacterium]MBW2503877.1 HyaD/HybD family hydrogenase maturation endopeptidase [Deltaproteobacteria bacterium]MBW2519827.1 HyaD/HybD family hydrogenase maturation endopeptidase [Deltaproteobacteria bacterium]